MFQSQGAIFRENMYSELLKRDIGLCVCVCDVCGVLCGVCVFVLCGVVYSVCV